MWQSETEKMTEQLCILFWNNGKIMTAKIIKIRKLTTTIIQITCLKKRNQSSTATRQFSENEYAYKK